MDSCSGFNFIRWSETQVLNSQKGVSSPIGFKIVVTSVKHFRLLCTHPKCNQFWSLYATHYTDKSCPAIKWNLETSFLKNLGLVCMSVIVSNYKISMRETKKWLIRMAILAIFLVSCERLYFCPVCLFLIFQNEKLWESDYLLQLRHSSELFAFIRTFAFNWSTFVQWVYIFLGIKCTEQAEMFLWSA